MVKINSQLKKIGISAKESAAEFLRFESTSRNNALLKIADEILVRKNEIIAANNCDVNNAISSGLSPSLIGRMKLDESSIKKISEDIVRISQLKESVGIKFDKKMLPNGLEVSKIRVPIGVIGVIYESRPNVTVDISAICIKSSNSVILRGGSDAFNSNSLLSEIIRNSIDLSGLPKNIVQFVPDTNREIVNQMLSMNKYIDLMVPRGGSDLIKYVSEKATMPSITGGIGVCHIYVDSIADISMAVSIVDNAKTSNPYVCNAVDTVILHKDIASEFLDMLLKQLSDKNVKFKCDVDSINILKRNYKIGDYIFEADESDWGKEFLGLTLAVKIVDSFDSAVSHIQNFGSGHSECIITEISQNGERFLRQIDASAVFLNSSTRFNDGAELGLGAEVAISTNKIHARGPMGPDELTSYKWIIQGDGQIRE
ncbi:MAG: glutamate-5-semialdehyde dehydrogenase [SAR202 cluster bacterium]|nr:glutamate-5-semialdehyde dehydrogenase [SAR202 cluster bacterium]|tara:strand:+ start:33327 stop:34607 length:1281 start_codon:yes stop_codon:yes gene_type:complete